MNSKQIKRQLCFSLTLFCLIWALAVAPAFAQGTGFSYQGRLTTLGNPADGLFDMQFKLFDTAVVDTGSQQGPTVTNPSVQVTNAIFTVQLDFGAGVFTGEPRFLEIGVRAAGSPDPHTILSPRQPLTSIPYSVRSAIATTADTAMNATQLGGQPAGGFIQNTTSQQAATNFNIGGNGTVGGTMMANTAVVNGNLGIGTATPTERLDVAGNGLFTGNLTANGSISGAGLRTQVNAASPNVIGGNSGNFVTASVVGAAIGGGGDASSFNRVTDNFGAIGGGVNNQAGDNAGTATDRPFATVGGGAFNTASGIQSTVGGGATNTASGSISSIGGGSNNTSSGSRSTVGGGQFNTASNSQSTVGGGTNNIANGPQSTVGGGESNTASGTLSTVPGGNLNTAAGNFSFAAGRRAKANHAGAFVWADSTAADFASTADNQFLIRASGGVGITGNLTVSGMFSTSGSISLVGLRTEANATSPNVVGGFSGNTVTASVVGATIGGGGAASFFNRVTDDFGTIGGGRNNQAGDNAGTTDDGWFATVSGGIANTASGSRSTVGGGTANNASGRESTIGGGFNNTASGSNSTVGGGERNVAFGTFSTVPGGEDNRAGGDFSFAAGRRAEANHAGAFVWADSTDFDFESTANDQFLIRASGGVGIGTTSPLDTLHVAGNIRVGTGTTGCVRDADGTVIAGSCSSDIRFKKQITPFSNLIDTLTRLQPAHFYWRSDEFPSKHFGSRQSFGLIAQEVEDVLPELVAEDEQGFKAVNYSKLPLMLLQAVKELKAENDSLRQRLEQQEERLRRLEAAMGRASGND